MGALITLPLALFSTMMTPFMYAATMLPLMCCCACQAMNCACSLWSCCVQPNTGINYTAAKVFYIVMLGLSTALAFVLKFTGHDWATSMGPFNVSMGCNNESFTNPGYNYSMYGIEAQGYCVGDAAVYRVSLALSLFFLFMLAFGKMGEGFFKGYWGFKVLLYGGAMIGCFFIPEFFFSNGIFQTIARIASALFLIIQILILVDFAYRWDEKWGQNAYIGSTDEQPTQKAWLYLIIFSSFMLFAATITVVVLLYIFYGTCPDTQGFISVSLILGVIGYILTIFRQEIVGEQGSLLPSMIVSLYVMYLTWSALQSNPDASCRPPAEVSVSTIIISILIAALSLCWTSFRATAATQKLLRGADEDATDAVTPAANDPNGQLYEVEDGGKTKVVSELKSNQKPGEEGDGEEKGQSPEEAGENVLLFFANMVAASLYMSMILTNWGEPSADINGQTGHGSMWAKMVSAWVSGVLYIWTLIAPRVCKGFRQFS